MKKNVISFYAGSYTVFVFSALFTSTLHAQIDVSSDAIPYDMFSADLYIPAVKDMEYIYEEYGIERKTPAYAGQTQYIEEKGLNQIKRSGYGLAIGFKSPVIYYLINKKERRFRIADDFGISIGMLSNRATVRDVLTGERIYPTYLASSNFLPIDLVYTFHYGLQAHYRISNTFDIGLKYLPAYANGNSRLSVANTTLGINGRINRFYIDYRHTKYKMNKNVNKVDYDTKGAKFLSVKYLLPENFTFKENGYVFASVQYFSYKFNDLWQTGGAWVRPGYENYQQKNSKFTIINVGVGIMVN